MCMKSIGRVISYLVYTKYLISVYVIIHIYIYLFNYVIIVPHPYHPHDQRIWGASTISKKDKYSIPEKIET